jgi:hypothetical protein
MSYLNDRMSVLAYANGFTLWHFRPDAVQSDQYRTLDDYLSGAGDILRVNDLIIVDPAPDVGADGSDATSGGFFRVRRALRGDVSTDPLF